jgi:hypothetical protein
MIWHNSFDRIRWRHHPKQQHDLLEKQIVQPHKHSRIQQQHRWHQQKQPCSVHFRIRLMCMGE